MRAFSILLAVIIVALFPCFEGKAGTETSLSQKANAQLIEMQRQIDNQWDRLQLTRKICEVNCAEGKCRCLDELRAKEVAIIETMVLHASIWNTFKTKHRPFTLGYYWNPEDALCRSDLKELLVAFPDSSSVKSQQLGLQLYSQGNPQADLAKVLQELYAQKKITDIQDFLRKVGMITVSMPAEFNLNLENLPYFLLVSEKPKDEGFEVVQTYFYAEVYDHEIFSDLENRKFPWTPSSISLLVALAYASTEE